MDYAFILGIDVASRKLDICLRELSADHCSFSSINYSDDDLDKFLTDNGNRINSSSCLVGLESTGEYHLAAARFFLNRGFKVKILNPILTKQYIRTTIRGTKTDKTDSEIIAKLLLEGHGDYLTLDRINDVKKELLRLSNSLTRLSSQLQLCIRSFERKDLGEAVEAVEQQMKDIASSISGLSKQIVKDATVDRSKEEEYVDSIPGFAVKLSAIICQEIDDINRFPDSSSLVAYAGLDPEIKQSGEFLKTTGRITKRGSRHLRSALFLGANVARNFDTELKAYYQKKKAEGRSHKEILVMISRKLIARIYVVLKEQRCYVVR